jgi:hypothetical protein
MASAFLSQPAAIGVNVALSLLHREFLTLGKWRAMNDALRNLRRLAEMSAARGAA